MEVSGTRKSAYSRARLYVLFAFQQKCQRNMLTVIRDWVSIFGHRMHPGPFDARVNPLVALAKLVIDEPTLAAYS
jgi:hypothetical protein